MNGGFQTTPHSAVEPASDQHKRAALELEVNRLRNLPLEYRSRAARMLARLFWPPKERDVCVDARRFLDGNEDYGSLGCNLHPHPGMQAFRDFTERLVSRAGVSHVCVLVSELVEEPCWPFAENMLLCTAADEAQVRTWFAELQPNLVGAASTRGMIGIPPTPSGHNWWIAWWD